ncbi:MAG: acetate--CoA ligase family protein [Proteobacteria bacterium]|nr:acetate--CoA ligase family protein [Pseudomonadota bacterium]
MTTTRPATDLQAALAPRSVAVIGASTNPNKIGGRPIAFMGRFGYRGTIYPINPNAPEVQGHKSFASIAALPEAPDMAVVAVPGDAAVTAVEECAARGVKLTVVMTSGFGEVNADGLAKQKAMVATAHAAGMRLVGPNTMGLANFGTGAVPNFSTMFVEMPPKLGPVAIVSQSGAMSVVPYGLLMSRGVGIRHCHATGNEADLSVADFAYAIAAHDPEVKLLLLYLEAIANPERLAAAAKIARERDLPIVALKSARSPRAQAVASSHTGALANEDRVVDAFLRQHGIWRADDVHGLVNAAELYLTGWRPSGRNLVMISNSGASCVMTADIAHGLDMPFAQFTDQTRRDLAAKLPAFASSANPIDVTAALLTDSSLFGSVLPILAKDPAVDALLVSLPVAGEGYDVERREPWEWPKRVPLTLPAGSARFLSEWDSVQLLGAEGIKIVPQRLCKSRDEAIAAFRAVGGGPVVIKGCSAEVPHKSEAGLVRLGIATEAEAGAVFDEQWARMAALKVARDGVIVAAMVKGRRELALGARVDPTFGPIVLVGDGGKYIEALGDVALLLPPFAPDDVLAALRRLRIAPILDGVRGEPALDLAPLCAMAMALGQVMVASAGRIASIDVNPVIVGTPDGAVAVDALIERA